MDEITYPFSNTNGVTLKTWDGMIDFVLEFGGMKLSMLGKRVIHDSNSVPRSVSLFMFRLRVSDVTENDIQSAE